MLLSEPVGETTANLGETTLRCGRNNCVRNDFLGETTGFHLSRSTRSWNSLPKELTDNKVSLNGFKNGLIEYYKLALRNVYDVNDPRTWKSICLSCNMSSNLSCQIMCSY